MVPAQMAEIALSRGSFRPRGAGLAGHDRIRQSWLARFKSADVAKREWAISESASRVKKAWWPVMMTFGKVVRRWKTSFSMIVAHVPVIAPERGFAFRDQPRDSRAG
jgi:hypothetical protein